MSLSIRLPNFAAARRNFERNGYIVFPSFSVPIVHRASWMSQWCRSTVRPGDRPSGSRYPPLVWRRFRRPRQRECALTPRAVHDACVTEVDSVRDGSPDGWNIDAIRSAININCLSQAGQQYPWHTDATPYTGLLFLTSLPERVGGELLVKSLTGEVAAVVPSAGAFVLMDGSRCAHAVAPLVRDALRVSVPMVFPKLATVRPQGLDDYLYSTSHRSSSRGSKH